MKILFVRPKSSEETIGLQHVMIVEPLELEVLASLLDKEEHPIILDMILEKNSPEYFLNLHQPDVLCLTGYITNVKEMIEWCQIAKNFNKNVATVIGGVHCEVCPEDFEDNAVDFRVVRNATTSFPKLLKHIKQKKKLPPEVLTSEQKMDIDKLPPFDFYYPLPNRELTKKYRKNYFYIFQNKVALLKTAFGCPYRCNFCFCRQITKDRYFERPLDSVMEELKSIKEKEVYIVDDDFLTTSNKVNKFLDEIEKCKIKKSYLVYGRADFIANNIETMKRFKKNGLSTVIVGFESFDNKELDKFNKKVNVQENEKAMKILNKMGIDCFATIILSPDWGKEDFKKCGEKIIELGIKFVNLQPLTPLPGTEFNEKPENILISKSEYEKWDLAHISIRPSKMTVAEYYKSIIDLYQKVLFRPSIMWEHLKRNSIYMLFKMMSGSAKVKKQYMNKYNEALKLE